MNKELIKKYKAEFEHWLNGGEVLFFYWDDWFSSTENPKMTFNHNNPEDVKYYIINDEYVEFRKALAEGKTIQVWEVTYQHLTDPKLDTYDWKDFKSFTQSSTFTYSPERYRIKPEEPKFKVGDWLIEIHSGSYAKVLEVVEEDLLRVKLYDSNAIITTESTDFTYWQPKPGEWCWFLNKGKAPILMQFHSLEADGNRKYSATFPNTPHPFIAYYEYCEPFLGTLPSTLKN